MIRLLEEERWKELEGVFDSTWSTHLPNTGGKANIIADVADDGSIQSFLVAEYLLRIGQVRSRNGYPRGLIRWLEEHMPRETSVIVFADEPRFEKLCELLKMRPVEGQIFRRDF